MREYDSLVEEANQPPQEVDVASIIKDQKKRFLIDPEKQESVEVNQNIETEDIGLCGDSFNESAFFCDPMLNR